MIQERGATEDVISRVDPADPGQREEVARVQHREGFPVEPSLSPDGRLLAYISAPDSAQDVSYQSELYVRDLVRQETELVTTNVDLRFRPLWEPASKLLYVRRFIGQHVAVLQITIARKPAPGEVTPTPTPTITPDPNVTPDPRATPTATPTPIDPVKTVLFANFGTVTSFSPIGIGDDNNSLYVLQVLGGTGGGTSVAAYTPGTSEEIARLTLTPTPPPPEAESPPAEPTETPLLAPFFVQLSDQPVHDFDFSPERRRIVYLVDGLVDGQFVSRGYLADLVAKAVVGSVSTQGLPPVDHLHPVWRPDGQWIAVGLLPSGEAPNPVAVVPVAEGAPAFFSKPAVGFDVPIAWSPDDAYLAVDNFNGTSIANPGSHHVDLLTLLGHRVTVAAASDLQALGWVK